MLLVGCESSKLFTSTKTDSTKTSSTDSGQVKRNNTSTDSLYEYIKRTWYIPPATPGKDGRDGKDGQATSFPVYYPAYTEEYGKGSTSTSSSTVDSTWKKAFDSLSAKVEASSKTKETQVVTWQHLIVAFLALAVFAVLFWQLLRLSRKFRIIKL